MILLWLLSTLVVSCSSDTPDLSSDYSPSEQIFLELWETFDQHYAFFELRGVDWKKEKEALFTWSGTIEHDTMLFDQICTILQKFDDTHINLESDSLGRYCNAGQIPKFLQSFPTNESFGRFLAARDQTLRKIGIDSVANSPRNVFQYGKSPNQEWGYLRIKRFYGGPLIALQQEMDEIMNDLRESQNLIIDIRANPGGNDETALMCAGYFFSKPEIAFIKKVRNGADYEAFAARDTSFIIPNEIRSQAKQMYLLTNRASGSSADVFALVMSYLPNLSIYGTNTEGIFSDMYRDTLSNGWRFTLSNERYFSKEMKCYEKTGIPVDYPVENTRTDVSKGIDLVLKQVMDSNQNK